MRLRRVWERGPVSLEIVDSFDFHRIIFLFRLCVYVCRGLGPGREGEEEEVHGVGDDGEGKKDV